MVTDIKIIRTKRRKARNRFRAGVLIFLKNALKKLAIIIRPKKMIKKIDSQMSDIIRTNKRMILNLKEMRNYGLGNNARSFGHAHSLTQRIFASIVIICLISMQALLINGFEAHVINVTAKIVNDVPDIEPGGGEFCNILGATITLSTTLTSSSTIIYTLDGSDPVCPGTGNIYTAPFTIYQSATVKARACHDGKQSAVASEYFAVSIEHCGESSCNAEPIDYWQNNEGCENEPALSNYAVQINNLSSGHFQGAFATTSAADICAALNLNNCPLGGTIDGEFCRAKAAAIADLSNVVSGRLDLAAVIAGGFDNSQPFISLGLTASSTIEEALDKIEAVLVNPSATLENLEGAGYIAERIYTFYGSENPYPSGTCIYWEPGDIVLNEFVPNPSCAAQPVDVALVMDTSGSMNYDGTPTRLEQAKTAAIQFVSNLENIDQSALVSYSTTASLKKLLSNDHASTTANINNLTAIGATNIGDGIAYANNEMTSIRANPQAAKIEVLLTDGLANKPNGPGYGEWPADVAYAKAKADQAALLGIKIFTIGLGNNVNTSMLQYIATTTGAQYYFAPTGADLAAIYNQISQELCDNIGDDQTGVAGEWVELYNKGGAQKDLVDWMITNTSATSTVTISAGNTLTSSTIIDAAGSGSEWLVVLFNEARLDNNGDTIFLYDNVNHLLDFYSYASSTDSDPDSDPDNTPGEENTYDGDLAGQEGKSFARIPDGIGEWIDPIPTPGGPNRIEENIPLDTTATSTESSISQNNDALAAPTEQALSNDNAGIADNNAVNQPDNNQDNGNLILPENILENSNNSEFGDSNSESEAIDEETLLESGDIATSSESGEIVSDNDDNIGNEDNSDNSINNDSEIEEAEPEPAPEPEPSQDEGGAVDPTEEQAKEPVKLIDTEAPLNNQETIL